MTKVWKQWEGQVVNGQFPLLEYLGASDHSGVFLTEYGESGLQRAAIKLIPTDSGNAELQLSRWGLAAGLSHPRLIRLFHMGRSQLGNMELLYVVMEYAEEDLSKILPERPLTPQEAREMLEPVLDALAYLHGRGFVHGHIKPANIMAVDDQLKISSDGLSRTGESRGGLDKPGAYDPPEFAGEISPAGDVWSLGMTLVEALTQRLPVWEEKQPGEPILPEKLPAPFLDFARHCLRRDPQRRGTVADCLAQLRQASDAPEGQSPARSQEALPKRRYAVPAIAIGLAVVAAMLAGPRLLKRQPESERVPPIAVDQPTISSGSLAPEGIVRLVVPDVPQSARDTIRGTVRVSVRVNVNPSGSVVRAELDSPGPSKYFANLAFQAAQDWKFAPTKADRRNVSSEWILRFEFTRTATQAFPVRAAP